MAARGPPGAARPRPPLTPPDTRPPPSRPRARPQARKTPPPKWPAGPAGPALQRLDGALNRGEAGSLVTLATQLRDAVAPGAAPAAASAALATVLQGKGRTTRALAMLLENGGADAALAWARLFPKEDHFQRALLRAVGGDPAAAAAVAASGHVDEDEGACALLAAAGRARDRGAVRAAVAAAAARRCASTPALNAALRALTDVGDVDKLYETYAAFRRAGAVPTTRTFNALLRGARAARDLRAAVRLHSRMVRLGPPPDAFTVAAALSAAGAAGRAEPGWAVAVFRGGGPAAAGDPACVAALLYALRAATHHPPDAVTFAFDAADALRDAGAADAWVAAECLHLGAAAGAPRRARGAWADATAGGTPTPHLYSALFTCAAASPTDDMVALADAAGATLRAEWDRVVARAAPAPPAPPLTRDHLVAHNALMHALAAAGRADDARMLLDVMIAAGPPPTHARSTPRWTPPPRRAT